MKSKITSKSVKIAALQLPTLSLSHLRLDYYLKAAKESGANLVALGEYVLNSFFTELLLMPRSMIKEQSEIKKKDLIKLAKNYDLEIIAPFIEVSAKSYKKVCLKVNAKGTQSYSQQILMPYNHWNEEKFFANKSGDLKLFSFSYENLKCALMMGFEVHFDFFWQEVRNKKIDLVIIPTASTFQSDKRWLELLKTRAFLNSVNILRINRIGTSKGFEKGSKDGQNEEWLFYGNTLFIDAYGQVVDSLGDKEEMLICEPLKASDARNLWGFEKIEKKFLKANNK